MKKITCLFAALLAFIGVANAQETKDPYTLAQGAEVLLSTDGGTQYAYYLRCKEQDNKLAYMITTETDSKASLTASSEEASKVVLVSETGGTAIYIVNDQDEKIAKWRGSTPITWIIPFTSGTYTGRDDSQYRYTLTKNAAENNGVTYNIRTRSKYLGFGTYNGNTDILLNNANSSLTWQFIPANDAAKQAAGWPKVNILQGDDVHGNLTTFSSSKAVILPSTYNVYTASLNNTMLELTEKNADITVDGNLSLPAETPVVIKGEEGSTYAIPFTDSRTTTLDKGSLQGTNETTLAVTDDTHYALGMPDAELGFFKVKSGTSIGANKAFLNIPTGSAAIKMVFADNNTTGIQTATSVEANANAPIFDLSGRRVANAVKGGVYIQNGKKFVK